MTPSVSYSGIVAARVDREGNLRLYRRRWRLFTAQAIFHPVGAWAVATVGRQGDCIVTLIPPRERS
jgi:hypothetical protein